MRGLPTLRAYRRGAAQTDSIATYTDDYRRATMSTLRIAFLSAFALELAASLGTAVVAVELGIRLVHGTVALSPAFAILVLAPELYAPLRTASAQFHASADGLAAASRLFELIELDVPAVATGEAPEPGVLRLEQIAFSYPERGCVLNGVDLELQPGERVAIVGPSGAGKSTLLAVLLRFVDADAGRATVDGIDLATVNPGAWRRQLAWVPQRPLLEPGTVAEAVRLGDASTSDSASPRLSRPPASPFGSTRRCTSFRSANSVGSRSLARSSAARPCCSSTSRRLISTRARPSGSSTCSPRCRAPAR